MQENLEIFQLFNSFAIGTVCLSLAIIIYFFKEKLICKDQMTKLYSVFLFTLGVHFYHEVVMFYYPSEYIKIMVNSITTAVVVITLWKTYTYAKGILRIGK